MTKLSIGPNCLYHQTVYTTKLYFLLNCVYHLTVCMNKPFPKSVKSFWIFGLSKSVKSFCIFSLSSHIWNNITKYLKNQIFIVDVYQTRCSWACSTNHFFTDSLNNLLMVSVQYTPSPSNHNCWEAEILSEGSPPPTCHMSHVMCHVSHVTFHVSQVMCYRSNVKNNYF